MSDFQFAHPDWSAGLWVVLAIVVLLLWLERRRGDALSRLMSPVMQSRLVSRPSLMRRGLVIMMLGLSAACLVVALMRPQFGLTYVKSPRVGAQIMFCLDVSKSMLAEDTAPNRLDRAKADIADLLTFLDGDQVGLIGFAGRASVLCPLTPDYGFFKLTLDNANSGSVGRGGTRLEEPIRKALNGFRTESDVSRVIFLITDGEDHDSHPLDAAQEAVERGIRVVAVGLGDEAGSEIRVTDPRTGVQSQVLDVDGNPVVTRLDGETLRELALATEGVYIPAGTGSLDLKSIYDAHIKPLVRGEMQAEGRAVRRDAFQWAILVGFVFLLASVVLGSGRAAESTGEQNTRVPAGVSRAAMLVAMSLIGHSNHALADQRTESNEAVSAAQGDASPSDPRQIYNQGSQRLQSDLDQAEDLLTKARQEAAGDGEVRFRATYNMGWVEINRADALIDQEPEQALEHLQFAAGWFRDAVRLRGDSADARHNLEVVLLRILRLRDQLSQQDDNDLATRLDALITAQRNTINKLRMLVERVAASDDPNIADEMRSQFQGLAVDQRVAISDLQDIVDQGGSELESLEKKAESERTPEESIRMTQLVSLLNDLNEASQRLGQSRSQLRRRQASRSFRRAASGLNHLKRARDQLRGPLQILDGILADASTTAQQTALKSLEKQVVSEDAPESIKVPRWIDQEYLADGQADLSQRTEELTNRLAAGLESGQQNAADDPQKPELTPEQQEFFAKLQLAMPHLLRATEAMKLAGEKIGLPEYDTAYDQQVEAIKALTEAREQFADIRGLIELAYATQSRIADALDQFLGPPDEEDETRSEKNEEEEADQGPLVWFVSTQQAKNLQRMERLKQQIATEMSRTQSTPPNPDSVKPDSVKTEQPSPETQRLELASTLVDRAGDQMTDVADNMPTEKSEDDDEAPETDLLDAKDHATAAVETLEDLRRLYFSIVEHLQETAQRQTQLNDETEQLAGNQAQSNADDDSEDDTETQAEQSAKLASRQDELAEIAAQIAEALKQQAEQPTEPTGQGTTGQDQTLDPQQQAMIEQNAQKAEVAAGLVTEAGVQMNLASAQLTAEAANDVQDGPAQARPAQDEALEKLIEALQQLQPPQDQSEQPQDQQQDQQQQQQQQPDQNDQQDQQSEQDQQMNPSRLLQAVRDREAQRRRDQDQRQRASQVPVERDW